MAIATQTDIFISGHSMIHRWAVRPKLLSLLALMFAIALVRHLVLIPPVLLIVALLYLAAALPWRYLLWRLPYPGLFIMSMVALLPWVAGDTILWEWTIFALRLEGLQSAALIMGRFLAIMTTGLILLGTTPFLDMLRALRSLGLPPLLMDMTLLTYRYLFDIMSQLSAMGLAMRLRGYGLLGQTLRRQWGLLASLFGSLLFRSYERSQRVYKAMRLRGYGQGGHLAYSTASRPAGRPPTLPTILTLLAALGIVIGESTLTFL